MAKRKLNDEKIVAALIAHNSVRGAAEAVGVSEGVIYERMKDAGFMGLYDRARTDLLRGCVGKLSAQMGGAVDVIASVMNDADVNPAVRVQAARQILDFAAKYSDRLTATTSEDSIVDVVGGIVVKMKKTAEEETPLDALSRALMEDWYGERGLQLAEEAIKEIEAGRDSGEV